MICWWLAPHHSQLHMIPIDEKTRKMIVLAAKKMATVPRRQYIAEATLAYCQGSPSRAHRMFGWGYNTVAKSLREKATGIVCLDAFHLRGETRAEVANPKLAEDIQSLAEAQTQSQADPQFKSTFAYTRLTGQSLRDALIAEKGWQAEQLPGARSLRDILNRLGFKLRRVQKRKPQKKSPRPTQSSTTSGKSREPPPKKRGRSS